VKNPPNAWLFRLIWPPGELDHQQTKIRIPWSLGWGRAHSILLRRRKNQKCSELSKIFGPYIGLHATTGSHLDDMSKHFSFLKSSSVSLFLGPKSQKVDLKVPFSNSKNSNIINDLLAGASEHKSEKFFFVFKFLKYFDI